MSFKKNKQNIRSNSNLATKHVMSKCIICHENENELMIIYSHASQGCFSSLTLGTCIYNAIARCTVA